MRIPAYRSTGPKRLFVTVGAFETLDLERKDFGIRILKVTFLTIHFHMFSHKWEFRKVMIELGWEPILGDMASFAIGDPVLGEVITMDIVMAIETCVAQLAEGPVLFVLHMAGRTRRRNVRSFQGELGGPMLFQCIHAHFKSVKHRMTFCTIRCDIVLREFTLVVVLMTATALTELHGTGEGSLVALLTIHIHVLALQRKVGDGVVEEIH